MGYYSQVTITMYKNDLVELVRSAKENQSYAYDLIKYAKILTHSSDENVLTIHWNCVKWYNSEDITFIENFLHQDNVPYSFKSVGEDGATDEENNDDDWYLSDFTSVMHYIDIDGSEQEDDYIDTLISMTSPDISDEEVIEVTESEFMDVLDAS